MYQLITPVAGPWLSRLSHVVAEMFPHWAMVYSNPTAGTDETQKKVIRAPIEHI